jgi:hypothetical protein
LLGAASKVFSLERSSGADVWFELGEKDSVVFSVGDVTREVGHLWKSSIDFR